MRPRVLVCLASLLAVAGTAAAERRYILRAKPGAVHGLAARHGLQVLRQAEAGGSVLVLVEDPQRRAARDLEAVAAAEPELAGFEPDQAAALPESVRGIRLNQSTVAILDRAGVTPFFGHSVWSQYVNQAAGRIIRLPDAHLMATGAGKVAIIDTGVDPRHPILAGSLEGGYDFIEDRPGNASELVELNQSTVAILDAMADTLSGKEATRMNQSTVAILDQSTVAILDGAAIPAAFGHGTMVAGLVHLVAPTARIMPLRAFRADGSGSLFDIVRAVYHAVDAGARVINMSFSLDAPSKELEAAISYANSRRVICVASAGNSGSQAAVYPAAWRKAEGVGSTTDSDARSAFSNYGDGLVSVAAPGENLITAYPGSNYAAASGTSFSTALVSGAAALLVELNPNLNQAQAAAALSRAVPVVLLGAGRIDLLQACSHARRR